MKKTLSEKIRNLPRSLKLGITGLALGAIITAGSIVYAVNERDNEALEKALKYGVGGVGVMMLSIPSYQMGLLEKRKPLIYRWKSKKIFP